MHVMKFDSNRCEAKAVPVGSVDELCKPIHGWEQIIKRTTCPKCGKDAC